MDRLPAHKDKNGIELLKKNGIEARFFPVKTSHFLQPLDQLIFAIFNNGVRRDRLAQKQSIMLTKKEFLTIFEKVINHNLPKGLQQDIVKKSWIKTGLWPWSSNLIEKMLFENVGLPKNELNFIQKKAEKSKSFHRYSSSHI